MKTVDIAEAIDRMIEKVVLGEWKHEGHLDGFTENRVDVVIDGRRYAIKIEDLTAELEAQGIRGGE
ncbi:hypothetical protein A5N82_13390 [Christensenella minuta]|nr:hypothetical protein [Christensenella minuta]AYH41606.1 hypothetical protein B1H56_14355 [Christensenella minuta]OAQ38689.1 hypothetical protein A5N82_13390 [Christensenella minuta]